MDSNNWAVNDKEIENFWILLTFDEIRHIRCNLGNHAILRNSRQGIQTDEKIEHKDIGDLEQQYDDHFNKCKEKECQFWKWNEWGYQRYIYPQSIHSHVLQT